MSERGQRTTIRFGGVRAPITLYKSSGKPTAAKHETRRVAAGPVSSEPDLLGALEASLKRGDPVSSGGHPIGVAVSDSEWRDMPVTDPETGEPTGEVDRVPVVDVATSGIVDTPSGAQGMADAIAAAESRDAARRGFAGPEADPLGDAPVPSSAPPIVTPPATTVQQGVTAANGQWIDLTDRLEQIDQASKIDGMEVVRTIAVNSIHRERVRDAHYIACATTDSDAYRVLALLWHGLRETNRAAAVRWTKRSQQALGIIVARGVLGEDAHLLLLELEWFENMRPIPPRTLGPINAPVTGPEVNAAVDLVNAFAGGPSALNELRDERLGKRADLLTLAREGDLAKYVAPASPSPDVAGYEDLAAAFAQSAAALR